MTAVAEFGISPGWWRSVIAPERFFTRFGRYVVYVSFFYTHLEMVIVQHDDPTITDC